MKSLLIVLAGMAALFACNHSFKQQKEPLRFWYATNYTPVPEDTFSFWRLKMKLPNPSDSLLASDLLELNDTAYYVMVYTNEFNAPEDGDHRMIYVHGFGIVHYHALTWRNFGVLQSDNDSVNRLISLFVAKGVQMTTEREINCRHLKNDEHLKVFFRAPR